MNSASFYLCLFKNSNISVKLLWSAMGEKDNNKYLVAYTHHLRERFTYLCFWTQEKETPG